MPGQLREFPVRLPNRAEGLAGILHEAVSSRRPGAPRTGLLMVHSQGASKDGHKRSFVEVARQAAPLGIPAFRFDLLGEGESEDLLEDPYLHWRGLIPAVNYFWEFAALNRVVALGDCFGGLLAAYYAQLDSRIDAVVVWNIAHMNWTPDLLKGHEPGAPTPGSLRRRISDRFSRTPTLASVLREWRRFAGMLRSTSTSPAKRATSARPVPVTVIHSPSQPNAAEAIATAEHVFAHLGMNASHIRIPGVPFSREWKIAAYAVVRQAAGMEEIAA